MSSPAKVGRPVGSGGQPFNWRIIEGEFPGGAKYCFEVRPTVGAWKPFLLGVPAAERAKVVALLPGPSGHSPPGTALVGNPAAGPSPDGTMYCWRMDNAATTAQSYYVYLVGLPSAIVFGQENGNPHYRLAFPEIAAIGEGDAADQAGDSNQVRSGG